MTAGVPPWLVLRRSLGGPAFPSLVVVLHSEKITETKKKKKSNKQNKFIPKIYSLTNIIQSI